MTLHPLIIFLLFLIVLAMWFAMANPFPGIALALAAETNLIRV